MTTDKQDPSRAAFERWHNRFDQQERFKPLKSGLYKRADTQAQWDAWQASREQALTEAAQACDATAICHAMALLNREAGNAQGARNCATTIRGMK